MVISYIYTNVKQGRAKYGREYYFYCDSLINMEGNIGACGFKNRIAACKVRGLREVDDIILVTSLVFRST